jgi:hypothetical protein
MTFCRKQQDRSMDSVRQESQLYIAEDNKDADGSVDFVRQESQLYIAEDNKDADGSMDSGSRLYALIHEARIRRELIL